MRDLQKGQGACTGTGVLEGRAKEETLQACFAGSLGEDTVDLVPTTCQEAAHHNHSSEC